MQLATALLAMCPEKKHEPTARWMISTHVNSEHLWMLFSNTSRRWVVPLWKGLTSTSRYPQRVQRWHTADPELWYSRHVLFCAMLHTTFFPPVSFSFLALFSNELYLPLRLQAIQWEMRGREEISLQNCCPSCLSLDKSKAMCAIRGAINVIPSIQQTEG